MNFYNLHTFVFRYTGVKLQVDFQPGWFYIQLVAPQFYVLLWKQEMFAQHELSL